VSASQLGKLRHVEVHVSPGRGNRQVVTAYASLGIARDIAVVVPTFTAAAAVVARSDLVASLPASLVEVLGRSLGLRRVATPLAPMATTVNLVWHERTHQDPALRAFRDLVARVAI
jgi:DNA-binding transcriptional LysR family regulator